MSTTDLSPRAVRPRRIWRWLLAGAGLCFAATALVVYNFVTLNRDAATLRDQLLSALAVPPHMRIQITVGPVFLATVRAGLSVVDRIPAEARLALRGVRNASVGVYELDGKVNSSERAQMFSMADKVMDRRGWTRVVGVQDHNSVVLVYLPAKEISSSAERVCVAVCDDKHLVIVSGSLRLEPLAELAMSQHRLALR